MITNRKTPGGTCGVADAGEAGPLGPDPNEALKVSAGIAWAAQEKEKRDADGADDAFKTLLSNGQALKDRIKALGQGATVTFSKAEALTLVRLALYGAKGDKTA